jgi:hypothetical protein
MILTKEKYAVSIVEWGVKWGYEKIKLRLTLQKCHLTKLGAADGGAQTVNMS